MKNAIIIFIMFFVLKVCGQDNTRHYRQALFDLQNAEAQQLGMITGNSDTHKKYSNGTRNRMELGATLLHNNWENSGKVFTSDKEFFFESMDLDLSTGTLLIKVDDDIFSFSTDKVKKIVMNNIVYKILYNPSAGNYHFFEVVHNDDELEVLKGFKLVYKKASPHSMFNTGQKNSLRRKEVFYINTPKGIQRIKMSNNKINNLITKRDYATLNKNIDKSKNRRVISEN